jgi:hypothetical protein
MFIILLVNFHSTFIYLFIFLSRVSLLFLSCIFHENSFHDRIFSFPDRCKDTDSSRGVGLLHTRSATKTVSKRLFLLPNRNCQLQRFIISLQNSLRCNYFSDSEALKIEKLSTRFDADDPFWQKTNKDVIVDCANNALCLPAARR